MKREPKRARRRRNMARMKARAKRAYDGKPKAPFWADYLAICSCVMCGNPRRLLGLATIQERRVAPSVTCDA